MNFEERMEKQPYKTGIGLSLKIFFAVLLFVCVVSVVTFVINPFKQVGRIVNKTIDADNVLYNYEWFKQQYRDIGAVDLKIKQQQDAIDIYVKDLGPRTEWSWDDKQEFSRLNSILVGLRHQRDDMVATYNARANMANRQIFMGSDVPSRIE